MHFALSLDLGFCIELRTFLVEYDLIGIVVGKKKMDDPVDLTADVPTKKKKLLRSPYLDLR